MQIDPLCSQILHSWRSSIGPARSVLLAVSGGCDSMALLWIMNTLKGTLDYEKIAVAHVNHGLRGEESDADERLVVQTCAELGIDCFCTRVALPTPAPAVGLEGWGREARYGFFLALMKEHGFSVTATAHTADDQAETVALRLIRGCGLKGAGGIAPVRADRIVRPLLHTRRFELERFMTAHGHLWRTDSSNALLCFDRNRLRHAVFPVLVEQFPSAIDSLAAAAARFAGAWTIIEPLVNKWLSDNVVESSDGGACFTRALDTELAKEGVLEWFRRKGVSLSSAQLELLVSSARTVSSTVKLSGKWQAWVTRGGVQISPPGNLVQSGEGAFAEVNLSEGVTHCDGYRIEVVAQKWLVGDSAECARHEIIIDRELVSEGLICRRVKETDRFIPFGREREMGVAGFLKQQGLELSCRRRALVITDKGGRVVWVVGVRPDKRFAPTGSTREILKISCITTALEGRSTAT